MVLFNILSDRGTLLCQLMSTTLRGRRKIWQKISGRSFQTGVLCAVWWCRNKHSCLRAHSCPLTIICICLYLHTHNLSINTHTPTRFSVVQSVHDLKEMAEGMEQNGLPLPSNYFVCLTDWLAHLIEHPNTRTYRLQLANRYVGEYCKKLVAIVY